jgi:hypothetical protein
MFINKKQVSKSNLSIFMNSITKYFFSILIVSTFLISCQKQTDYGSQIANLTSSRDAMEVQLKSLAEQISLLNSQLASSNSNVASLTSQLAILNQKYLDLLARFDAIYGQTIPGSLSVGLAAYYPFNGNAIDSSGNGNTATVNGASLTADRNNISNRAYNFNGSGNSMNILNKTLSLSGNFSISCWVKINNLTPSYYDQAIFSQWDDRTGRKFLFGYRCDNPQSQAGFSLYLFSPSREYGNYQINWSRTSSWKHIVATYEQGVVCQIYINGQLQYSSNNVPSTLASPNSTTTPIEIGHAHGQYGDLWLNGLLDDLRIYNRLLTTNEIYYLASN